MGRLKHALGFWREKGERTDNFYSMNWRDAYEKFDSLIDSIPTKRTDSVGLFEVVITRTAPDFERSYKEGGDYFSPKEQKDFVKESKSWVDKTFGSENFVAWSVHRDEKVEHTHFFIVPAIIAQGKRNHGKRQLSAFTWTGGKKKMHALQEDIYEQVFSKFGLARGELAEKTHRNHLRPTLLFDQAKILERKEELEKTAKENELGEELNKINAETLQAKKKEFKDLQEQLLMAQKELNAERAKINRERASLDAEREIFESSTAEAKHFRKYLDKTPDELIRYISDHRKNFGQKSVFDTLARWAKITAEREEKERIEAAKKSFDGWKREEAFEEEKRLAQRQQEQADRAKKIDIVPPHTAETAVSKESEPKKEPESPKRTKKTKKRGWWSR